MRGTPLGCSLTRGVGERDSTIYALSPVGLVRVTLLNNWHGGSLTILVGDLLEDSVDALSPDVRVGALSPVYS